MKPRMRGFRRRRAMWKALNRFVGNDDIYAHKMHPIGGRHGWRMFEEVNGVPFDPLNPYHMNRVHDMRVLLSAKSLVHGFKEAMHKYLTALSNIGQPRNGMDDE